MSGELLTTRTRDDVFCRRCGEQLSAGTGLKPETRPKAGDISICAFCGALSVFDDELGLRPPTPEERVELQRRPDWRLIARAMERPPLRDTR